MVISEMLLQGELSMIFWPMIVFGLAVPALILVAPVIRSKWFSLNLTVVASVVILIAFWVKRFLIVVPSLLRPLLPFPTGTYNPSWVEWSVIAGLFALAVLIYLLFLKVFPMMEISEE